MGASGKAGDELFVTTESGGYLYVEKAKTCIFFMKLHFLSPIVMGPLIFVYCAVFLLSQERSNPLVMFLMIFLGGSVSCLFCAYVYETLGLRAYHLRLDDSELQVGFATRKNSLKVALADIKSIESVTAPGSSLSFEDRTEREFLYRKGPAVKIEFERDDNTSSCVFNCNHPERLIELICLRQPHITRVVDAQSSSQQE